MSDEIKVGDRFVYRHRKGVWTGGRFVTQSWEDSGRVVVVESVLPDGRFVCWDGAKRTKIGAKTLRSKEYRPADSTGLTKSGGQS